jgi:hypothetical protein
MASSICTVHRHRVRALTSSSSSSHSSSKAPRRTQLQALPLIPAGDFK